MKPRRTWIWLLLGLVVVLLGGVALLPRQVGDVVDLSGRVASALSAWTGGEVNITGPLSVRYFPRI
jgi:hypothetical protein